MKESLCRLPRISSCKPGLSWEVEVEKMTMFLIMWEWKMVILMHYRYEHGHWLMLTSLKQDSSTDWPQLSSCTSRKAAVRADTAFTTNETWKDGR